MDLKSKGRTGRSFVNGAVGRVSQVSLLTRLSRTQDSNIDNDELAKKVEALFSEELLFERLDSEPKWRKAYASSVKQVKSTATYVKNQKMPVKVAGALAMILLIAGIVLGVKTNIDTPAVTEVAGTIDTIRNGGINSLKLPIEKPSFELLKPTSRKGQEIDTVRVSPSGNDPVYTFIDTIEGQTINVSQQKIPKSFDYNKDAELERVAKDFQATDVIQIDGIEIYHGLNEKTKIQSLVFIKEGLLIFIKSPVKLTDDTWAGYILALQKY